MKNELLEAALEYARQGWYIFPIKPGSKKPPLIKAQYENSTTDEKIIRQWWGDVPGANIGLDCGKSGVDVIDIDAKHAGILKEFEALKFITGGRKAWQTRIHQTPGGGYHYVFTRLPPDIGVLPSKSAAFGGPGIDTRTQGGYIILPPSSLTEYKGKKYQLLQNSPIIPLPVALLTLNGKKEERNPAGKTELEDILTSNQPLTDGTRNSTLHRICSKLLRIGLAEVETRDALLSINRLRCVPPLKENDVIYMVHKAYTYYKPVEDLIGDAAREESPGEWNDHDQTTAVSAGVFIEEQKDGTTWLLDGILPTSSLNMIQGNPKSGKSTFARHLAVAAASSEDFMGLSIPPGASVLYYSLQEGKKQWKSWLPSILSNEEIKELNLDIIWRLGKRGPHAVKGLRERILQKKYSLVIIDMIGRFLTLRDMDKYSEVEGPLSDMNDIAQETGACIVWLHHERKSGGGFEAGIGSQAFRGAVYTTVKCSRDGKVFSFETEQREGEDTDETTLKISDKHRLERTSQAARLMAKIQNETKKKGDKNG